MNYTVFAPEIIVLVTAALVLFGEWLFKSVDNNKEKRSNNIGFVALTGLFAALGTLFSFKNTNYTLVNAFFGSAESTYYNSFALD
ncbi:hypothetical protein EON78_02530, partial [bacterium]